MFRRPTRRCIKNPTIYLRDHPDVYIYTTGDVVIEPTKIKRSTFIAAASGYYLATMPDHGASLLKLSYASALERLAEDQRRALVVASGGNGAEAGNIVAQGLLREQRRLRSLSRFVSLDSEEALGQRHSQRGRRRVRTRRPQSGRRVHRRAR